jgi:exopolysaccharide biosynthesis polyprenyl glycosylphosphotransferase
MMKQLREKNGNGAPVRLAQATPSFPAASSASHSERILLAGTGRTAMRVCEQLLCGSTPRILVGVIGTSSPGLSSSNWPDVPMLGSFDDLVTVVLSHCVDHVHVAVPPKNWSPALPAVMGKARAMGLPVTLHVSLVDEAIGGPEDETLQVQAFREHPSMLGARRFAKRLVDVIVALMALVALLPLFAAIAILIKGTSTGPILFRQPRVGYRRRQFQMYKFRTMVENAEELRREVQALNDARGISFKVFRDPRVTRVGSMLRRSSLDELPQLFNVLRGEMTLVGPRPIPVWVAEQLEEHSYFRRFAVLPGLTGLWQVEGREQDFDKMARQDLRYIDRWSLGLDLKLLARTIPAVFRGEGAH